MLVQRLSQNARRQPESDWRVRRPVARQGRRCQRRAPGRSIRLLLRRIRPASRHSVQDIQPCRRGALHAVAVSSRCRQRRRVPLPRSSAQSTHVLRSATVRRSAARRREESAQVSDPAKPFQTPCTGHFGGGGESAQSNLFVVALRCQSR